MEGTVEEHDGADAENGDALHVPLQDDQLEEEEEDDDADDADVPAAAAGAEDALPAAAAAIVVGHGRLLRVAEGQGPRFRRALLHLQQGARLKGNLR